MSFQIFYRISDKNNSKCKLPGASKQRCLNNFLEVFQDNIQIIADNCSDELLNHLKSKNLRIVETNLGNSGSFRHALNLANDCSNDTLIYFVEDDYLHLPQSKELLFEGIEMASYVSLYDHPDKYGSMYDFGETAKIFKTKSSHWKNSTSTCMTFASTVKTLKEDYAVWDANLRSEIPTDHFAFLALAKSNHRVAVCIPGSACHIDLTYSLTTESNQIEPWAIQMMLKQVEQSIYQSWNADAIELMEKIIHFEKHETLERLTLIAQIEEMIKKSR